MDILFSQLVIYSGFSFLFQAIFFPSTSGTSSEGSVQVMTLSLMPPTPRIITNSIKTTLHFPLGEEEITEACLAQACESGFICLCVWVQQHEVKKRDCDCIGNICKSGEPQKLKESMGQWNADIPGTTSLSRVMFMDKLLNMYSTDYEMCFRMTVLYFPWKRSLTLRCRRSPNSRPN